MADWTTLSNQAVGVGGLPSGTTVTALRDNPVAIAEGATGAPKVAAGALDGLFLGALSVTENPIGFNDLGSVGQILIQGFISSGNNNAGDPAVFSIRFSSDNGSTFDAYQNLLPNSSAYRNLPLVGSLVISKDDGISFSGINTGSVEVKNFRNRAISIPNDANAFQLATVDALPIPGYPEVLVFLTGGQ